jgi:uncharacterized protein
VNRNEIIFYVADQASSRQFYATVLAGTPSLDVPGMTEFDLGGTTRGLMPISDIVELVEGVAAGSGQRCELYLRRADAAAMLSRVPAAGGSILSDIAARPWGEAVGYALDLDGHVLALAVG